MQTIPDHPDERNDTPSCDRFHLPIRVYEAVISAYRADDRERLAELCAQIGAVLHNGDPDPSNHDDYWLWMAGEPGPR